MDICNVLYSQAEKKSKLENITLNAREFSEIYDKLLNGMGPNMPGQFREIKRSMIEHLPKAKNRK